MSIRFVVAGACMAALGCLAPGPAQAQTSYANPYGYAYPQAPYPGNVPGYTYQPQGPHAAPAYPRGYAGSPYAPQGYGAAAYVQPSYGSPYAPQAGDPFPEYPAAAPAQPDTVVVSGATRAPAAAPPPAPPAPPHAERLPPEPPAVQPAATPRTATDDRPQAPAGTFDELHAARYSDPQVGEWQPDPQEGYGGWLSELRFGILEHDAGLWSGKKEDGLDINGEMLFVSPDFLEVIFSPRPTIGGSIHTEGETNVVYFGLTWEWNVTPWLYIEGQWGPAFHDGNLTGQTADKKGFGCAVLSRGSAAVGLRYEHHSIQAFYSHMSNGDICEENDGIDAAGVRYGYRF